MRYAFDRRPNTALLANHECPVLGDVEVQAVGGPRSLGFSVKFKTGERTETLYVDIVLSESMAVVPLLKYEGQGARAAEGQALGAQRAVTYHIADHIGEMLPMIASIAHIERNTHEKVVGDLQSLLEAPAYAARRAEADPNGVTLEDLWHREVYARSERMFRLSNVISMTETRHGEVFSAAKMKAMLSGYGVATDRHSPDTRISGLDLMEGEAATITDAVPHLRARGRKVHLAHFNFDDARWMLTAPQSLTRLGVDVWELRGLCSSTVADVCNEDTVIVRLKTPTDINVELACRQFLMAGTNPDLLMIGPEGTICGKPSELTATRQLTSSAAPFSL